MTNDEKMMIELTRIEVLDVKLAITGLIWDMKREMSNDPDCSEYRKTVVLPSSIKKWERLRKKIGSQFEAQDIAE